jgi:hypothetical protein
VYGDDVAQKRRLEEIAAEASNADRVWRPLTPHPRYAPTFATAARLINPIETDSAEVLALYDGSLEPELRNPYRGHVAAGPKPDDDDVKFSFGLHRRFYGLLRLLATRSCLKGPGADSIEQVDDVL